MYTWDYRRPDYFDADMQKDWNQTILITQYYPILVI
jgi:hypothetical protein